MKACECVQDGRIAAVKLIKKKESGGKVDDAVIVRELQAIGIHGFGLGRIICELQQLMASCNPYPVTLSMDNALVFSGTELGRECTGRLAHAWAGGRQDPVYYTSPREVKT